MDSKLKAEEFATRWMMKNTLPDRCCESYPGPKTNFMNEHIQIRIRDVKNILKKLDVSKATGPYYAANTRILKELAEELALPIAILIGRILNEGKWPSRWKLHNIAQFFKKNSVYVVNNYRGIHLTCNLSKIVEKCLNNPCFFLQVHGYGDAQWAFRKESRQQWQHLRTQSQNTNDEFSDCSRVYTNVYTTH